MMLTWAKPNNPRFLLWVLILIPTILATIDAIHFRRLTYSVGVDLWEHLAAVRTWSGDLWSPPNPHVASDEVTSRYMPYFFVVSGMISLLGGEPIYFLYAFGILNVFLFCICWSTFFRAYFGSTWASVIGLSVFLFCWGNPWFWSNVYALKHLTVQGSYPSIFALWLTALLWTFCLYNMFQGRSVFSRLRPIIVGGLTCVVLLSHVLTGVLALFGAVLLILFRGDGSLISRIVRLIPLVVGTLLTLLWPYYSLTELVVGGVTESTTGNVTEAEGISRAQESYVLHPFYQLRSVFVALGPALIGALSVLWLVIQRRHWFITLGACMFGILYVTNVFYTLPLGHRYLLFLVMFFHLAIITGVVDGVTNASEGRIAIAVRAVCIAALVIGLFLGAGSTLIALIRDLQPTNTNVAETYQSLAAHLSDSDVVMGKLDTTWPLPAFRGRVVGLYHANPLVRDSETREHDVHEFFDDGVSIQRRMRLISKYRVSHILAKEDEYANDSELTDFLGAFTRETRRIRKYQLFEVIAAPRLSSPENTSRSQ
jgi:hypothetical protein